MGWGLAAFLALMTPVMAAPPVATDHAVGTFQHLDEGSHRLVMSRDAKTGSSVGQGGPINLYYDDATLVSRDGAPMRIDSLQQGQRLLVDTHKSGNRVQARRVRVLASTTPGQAWGGYLHGTVREIQARSQSLHIDQSDTLISNRINYDEQTTLKTIDGQPLPLSALKVGDEVDMSVKMRGREGYADRVVVIRSTAGP
jgi:hypothetical protein